VLRRLAGFHFRTAHLKTPAARAPCAMPDRASYLANVFVTRLKSLVAAQGDRNDDDVSPAERRHQLVVKILAVEAGITDEATVQRVTQALPIVMPRRAITERELAEFADFLRTNLDLG
jgi:hypothetical protein